MTNTSIVTPLTRFSPEHDEESSLTAQFSPSISNRKSTLEGGRSSPNSLQSSSASLKLMLMMDPYGIMDVQPTKLPYDKSNSTLQTMQSDDSFTLPSIMGGMVELDEEEFFDPYNTNTLHTTLLLEQQQTPPSIPSPRLEQAAQDATFYLQEVSKPTQEEALLLTETTPRLPPKAFLQDFKAQEVSFYLQHEFSRLEEPLLFGRADEKATRLQEARKDVSFYLEQEFHDAQQQQPEEEEDETIMEDFQECKDEEEEESVSSSTPSTLPQGPLQEQPASTEIFQDCQDDDSVDHEEASRTVEEASPTDVNFYLQQQVLQKDDSEDDSEIDLEQEACPSPVPEKIASTTHRLDMDGAIRHHTVFYDNRSASFEEASLTSQEEEEEKDDQEESIMPLDTRAAPEEADAPMNTTAAPVSPNENTPTASEDSSMNTTDAPVSPNENTPASSEDSSMNTTDAPVSPNENESPSTPPEEPSTILFDETTTTITRISLDQFVPPRVFQRTEHMPPNRNHVTRIDMTGMLQPTQIYGPILTKASDDATTTSTTTKEQVSPQALTITVPQDDHDDKNQPVTELVGDGCGCWWFLFRR